jgi:hypothetical protein
MASKKSWKRIRCWHRKYLTAYANYLITYDRFKKVVKKELGPLGDQDGNKKTKQR